MKRLSVSALLPQALSAVSSYSLPGGRRTSVKKLGLLTLLALTVVALSAGPAAASHRWGTYHWSQASSSTDPSVSVLLGDNLLKTGASDWPSIFKGTPATGKNVVSNWSHLELTARSFTFANDARDIFETPYEPGKNRTSQKKCKPYAGQVEVCNARYGANGWLGLAQIWTSGGHIVQGTAKVNDTYFDSSRYTAVAKQHVLCQEVGHAFGLDHQDESGADFDTCMDYGSKLDNAHPDQHDNHTVNEIYRDHPDSGTSSSSTTANKGQGKVRRVRKDLYVESFPNGEKVFTFVTFTSDTAAARAPSDRVPE